MENGPHEQCVASFLPMATAFQCAFWVDQNICDVLNISDFIAALANFQKWIVFGACWIGRIKQQAVRELGTPTCGQLPVFAFDIVDDRTSGPA